MTSIYCNEWTSSERATEVSASTVEKSDFETAVQDTKQQSQVKYYIWFKEILNLSCSKILFFNMVQ